MKLHRFITITFLIIFQTKSLAQSILSTDDEMEKNIIFPKKQIKKFNSITLSDTLRESSGLIEWNNQLYTHNDDRDLNLYLLNKNGKILKSINLEGIQNKDWEAIAQDETHFYLGDIGNNVSGNRTDLTIYKIRKATLFDNPEIEQIQFTYSNQMDFRKQKVNKTDFDAEAIVVTENDLFIFTKQWTSKQTNIYKLPKTSGNFTAELIATLPVNGLISGATYVPNQNRVVLCGYSKKLKPFLYILFNFTDLTFEKSHLQKIKLKLPFHQIEGISTTDGINFYLTNEYFSNKFTGTIVQQLHCFSININTQ